MTVQWQAIMLNKQIIHLARLSWFILRCIIYLYDDNYGDDHSDVNDSDMKDDAHCNGLGYVEQADYTPGQTIVVYLEVI